MALAGIYLGFAWQAWHLWHWAGSGGALGRAWSPVTPRHFAWQAWHLVTSTFALRGQLPSFTHNFVTHHLSPTTLSHTIVHTQLCHTPSFTALCVAGVALGGIQRHAICVAGVHLETSTLVLRYNLCCSLLEKVDTHAYTHTYIHTIPYQTRPDQTRQTDIHTYIHTYIYTYIHIYIRTDIHTHTTLSHTTVSPPPLSFLPSPSQLQPLVLIIGRS